MKRFWFFIFLLLIINPAFADKPPLNLICDTVKAKLKITKYTSYSHNLGRFKDTYDDVFYKGCVITVAGIISLEPNYYKILMGLYPNPNNELGRKGWKADRQSDGPDGVSFTIVKKNLFCQVSGDWPGEFFKYRVECGEKK